MTLAALWWVIRPLLRKPATEEAVDPAVAAAAATKRARDRNAIIAVLAITLPGLSFFAYQSLSNFSWSTAGMAASTQGSPHGTDPNQIQNMIAKLEADLTSNPQNLEGWMMLGRSYAQVDRFGRAADAYEQAYKISGGENVDVIASLAEALALNDEASLASGRAGQLFETALVKAPNDTRSLWYGGMAAMQSGKLNVARDRFQLLLQQNPPDRIRTLLEQQIQDLNTQLGGSGSVPVADKATSSAAPTAPAAKGAAGAREIEVAVTISSDLLRQLPGPTPVFIIVRDPAGGPPFAVQRRLSAELPVTVRLNEQSAMVTGRSLATAPGKVQIIARIARSGTPQQQPGDFYGEAEYDFSQGAMGSVKISIDRVAGGANAAASAPPPATASSSLPAPAAGSRLLKVSISIAPALASKASGSAPLFVLARDPNGGGPPLAVKKHATSELPLTVELNESSAMVAGRSIANAQRVQVVARVSRSGAPMGQSGDLFGEAEYDFSKGAVGSINIVIDRTIP
jgi:cytochrome c-type biogenesis protein CcmH